MIYTVWGSEIEFLASYGEHQPKGFSSPGRLVVAKFNDGALRFRFVECLKADGGAAEIDEAYNAAEKKTLSGKDLADAIKEAL